MRSTQASFCRHLPTLPDPAPTRAGAQASSLPYPASPPLFSPVCVTFPFPSRPHGVGCPRQFGKGNLPRAMQGNLLCC